MSVPFIGFSNDTLDNCVLVQKGDLVTCHICGRSHPIEYGTDDHGQETSLLGYFKCGDEIYLASVSGRLVAGMKADVSGDVDL